MKIYERRTTKPEETITLATLIGERLWRGSVLTLEGDLGAGKTTFAKGLAQGLGVQGVVNSPTFTIIKEYEGSSIPFYHMDAYRLDGAEDDIGIDDYLFGQGVTVIEWPDIIADFLPGERLDICFFYEEHSRKIQLRPIGAKYESLCRELFV
ncbi:tRNA (adenosine(37)-N6)-threonylcarbamoyltransferase complex ATPase subunit type 1 TsaE [Bacillaceae bacterium SIJ1]|uniref:tRNA (adenosine(37)-N6)-threonylcarbamoyltransferase complex ATPase subunit type 1 TsaE n=1 Tax=Litoribacterium kuwaitense TaxID=1398745 RepID=UPI0013E9DA37|nr:tRNA (adenosine(37)-N6)-threonylcarbamoyltransferase complex ATPase subunit type 1 TsaE [Litoribacterium kuwaitense]NGP46547.1 tRNA (adenosine(37)-N6)-threonylcarbamoyltransferase complex ATPase subunit type 1 TsaE [Litoribacterium kuwaitense]